MDEIMGRDLRNNGIVLVADSIICCGSPDDSTKAELAEMGKILA